MVSEAKLDDYLVEIRKQVCSRCVDRPPGGPPCAPLGTVCGIEMHLPAIIDSIHQVKSDSIEPYLEINRRRVCEGCGYLHSSICPCPMDYLGVLLVWVIETVDERFQGRSRRETVPSDMRELWQDQGNGD